MASRNAPCTESNFAPPRDKKIGCVHLSEGVLVPDTKLIISILP